MIQKLINFKSPLSSLEIHCTYLIGPTMGPITTTIDNYYYRPKSSWKPSLCVNTTVILDTDFPRHWVMATLP